MKDWLTLVSASMILIIHSMALVVVAYGTVQAFWQCIRAMGDPTPRDHRFHRAYVTYARWLVCALTFQLGADIVATAFSPGWEEIKHLAAISVIRTFVSYFLERDLSAMEQREAAASNGERVVAGSS